MRYCLIYYYFLRAKILGDWEGLIHSEFSFYLWNFSTSLATSFITMCTNLHSLSYDELGSPVCKRSRIFTWNQTQRNYPQRPQASKVCNLNSTLCCYCCITWLLFLWSFLVMAFNSAIGRLCRASRCWDW